MKVVEGISVLSKHTTDFDSYYVYVNKMLLSVTLLWLKQAITPIENFSDLHNLTLTTLNS